MRPLSEIALGRHHFRRHGRDRRGIGIGARFRHRPHERRLLIFGARDLGPEIVPHLVERIERRRHRDMPAAIVDEARDRAGGHAAPLAVEHAGVVVHRLQATLDGEQSGLSIAAEDAVSSPAGATA
jgi:hypothetical protein